MAKLSDTELFNAAKLVKHALVFNKVNSKTTSNVLLLAHHLQEPGNRNLLFIKAGTWVPPTAPTQECDIKFQEQIFAIKFIRAYLKYTESLRFKFSVSSPDQIFEILVNVWQPLFFSKTSFIFS